MKNTIITKDEKFLPTKWSPQATCFDLRATEYTAIEPWEVKLVWTWVKTNFPNKIYARSSLPLKKGLMLANWVWIIDWDYTWEIKAQLYNFTDYPVTFWKGERIVQMEVPSCEFSWSKQLNIISDKVQYDNWEIANKSERWEWWFWSTWDK